ncbi:Subtilisin-like protease [Melia azedarach]|uniref:Subtilisin-like protease n=1 Tax=Melia azedarach TaxID=155640 RepID=A0ACC1XXZ8_MELAZ|nr:Subtilisin-like protease [Melia azedarach]
MGNFSPSMLILSFFLLVWSATSSSMPGDRRTYIIHMDKSAMPAPFSTHHDWYLSTLSSLLSSDGVAPIHLYTYSHVLDGFSAVLSQNHLDQLQKMPGHRAAYPETIGHLHTTRTPKFLGLKKQAGIWPAAGFGSDILVGVLDTGIWPESESFNDDGMPPVPERWRGTCEVGTDFLASNCNRKLIGARSFSKGMQQYHENISKIYDYDSPRDYFGHGSHTSSTIAGSPVQDADYFGYAEGTAIGVAPMARIAMYKVLFFQNSYEAAATDVLAGMDQAIADGVDVMSLSLGFTETTFDENPIAIGAFAALKKGIFVACSAGNSGPHAYTILNGAPWITTVGAGTIDREFSAHVNLDDAGLTVTGKSVEGGLTLTGKSVYPENLFVSRVPIYFGYGNKSKEICDLNSLDPDDVAGKYIFCAFDYDGYITVNQQLDEMYRTGASGAIFSSNMGQFLSPNDFNMPFVVVNVKDGELVKKHILHAENATVSIKFQITILGTKPAPQVADFSSRGPARRSPWILKPDILAPGVDILAAWAPNKPWTPIREDDYLLTDYALVSGTSMSCPHAAGIAALLKATHRDWSSAAIRSAMMTTANLFDNANGMITDMTTGGAGTPLDFGAGHVNPNKAMDPGLVYDTDVQDYINYLCALNYTGQQIKVLTGTSNFTCQNANLDLNYPSFIVILNNTNTTSFTFKRVLTNVADTRSLYTAAVQAPTGMKVVVQPAMVSFARKYSKAEFSLTVNIDLGNPSRPQIGYIGNFGFLTWHEVNGKHTVRSPIVSAFAP